jgi:hypothetical protein
MRSCGTRCKGSSSNPLGGIGAPSDSVPGDAQESARWAWRARWPLLLRLIADGSDALATQIYWRLLADRAPLANFDRAAPGWIDIAARAMRERMVTPEEVQLLLGLASVKVQRPEVPGDRLGARPGRMTKARR